MQCILDATTNALKEVGSDSMAISSSLWLDAGFAFYYVIAFGS
jgi:hypothetical protein